MRIVSVIAFFPILLTASAGEKEPAESFSYERLRSLIEGTGVTAIDELLPKLPDQCLKDYALVYRSQSAQARDVDFEHP